MKGISFTGTLLFLFFIITACSAAQDNSAYDLLITDTRVIDGSGSPAYDADILIHEGVIVEIGEIDPDRTEVSEIVNAAGRVASPGFIDTHSHGNPLDTPAFENFLAMGVTTISLGQDGSSPLTPDVEAWMDEIDRQGTGPNILHFKGHGTLRRLISAPLVSGLDEELIGEMQQLMEAAMQAGSFGMTTGLEYEPGTFADLHELVETAKPVAQYGGVVMSHMRSEDNDEIEDAIEELLNQARGSGAAVHLSHLKIVFGNDPEQADDILNILNAARKEGIAVTADVYPYTASFTGIGIVFPEWARPPHDFAEVARTQREELREYLRNRVEMRNGPEATLFGTAPWAGMTLADVAESLDKPFEDVLIDDIGPRGASAAYFVMNEEVMRRFLQAPYVMISSDGSPTMRHPRGHGTLARIIEKYVLQEGLLSLEEAIYKMSGLPAQTLGLDNPDSVSTPRGLVREGYAADILLFDPEHIRENATFEDPHQLAEGFDWVFVNGIPVIKEGEQQDVLPGSVVRKTSD